MFHSCLLMIDQKAFSVRTGQWGTGYHLTHREKPPKGRQYLPKLLNFGASKTGVDKHSVAENQFFLQTIS